MAFAAVYFCHMLARCGCRLL